MNAKRGSAPAVAVLVGFSGIGKSYLASSFEVSMSLILIRESSGTGETDRPVCMDIIMLRTSDEVHRPILHSASRLFYRNGILLLPDGSKHNSMPSREP